MFLNISADNSLFLDSSKSTETLIKETLNATQFYGYMEFKPFIIFSAYSVNHIDQRGQLIENDHGIRLE